MLSRLAGRSSVGLTKTTASLAVEHRHPGGRPTYYPAVFRQTEHGATVEPVRYRGSADLRGLAAANALACFSSQERVFAPGECVDVYLLDG